MRQISILFLLMISVITTSCGDLFMQDKKSDSSMSVIAGAQCALETKAFADIFVRDISPEIKCLNEKLDLFINMVQTDRPGFISQKTLNTFITSGSLGGAVDANITDIIDSIFELSYLILGGEKGYISQDGAHKLVDLLLYFNQHIWKVYKKFVDPLNVNYRLHLRDRQTVYNEMVHISKKIRLLLTQDRHGNIDRIDTEIFLSKFFGSTPETYNNISSLMFLKKVFLGGQKFDFTHIELEDALYKLPELSLVAFDLIKSKKFSFSDNIRDMMLIYNRDVSLAKDLLHYGRDDSEALFTIYDIFSALDSLVPGLMKDMKLRHYPRELVLIKETLLDTDGSLNNGKRFSSLELARLFDHMNNIFDEGEFFFKVYDFFRSDLDDPKPLTIDFSSYPAKPGKEEKFLADFTRIAYNYRYIKGTFKSPFFSFQHFRNPAGYMEIMALEYGVKLVMQKHGSYNKAARGMYHMTVDQTVGLISKIKRFLRDNGITTVGRVGGGEAVATAENLVLMSTLFQNQSNGCNNKKVCMEVPEMTEFLVGLLTALSIKDFFIEEMQKLCGNDVDEFGRIYVQCFRDNFINVLKEPMKGDGRSLADYMPLLYSYMMDLTKDINGAAKPTDSQDYVKFLSETESFTRTCTHFDETTKEESLPMKSTDAFAVFAGLLNVESTVLRFDTNENNIMDGSKDHNEVMAAYYEVYQGAIKSLVAPTGGFMAKLAKPIFQYLVKYGKVPDTSKFKSIWGFAKFLLRVNKRADASRTTIATILKTLGEQSATGKEHPFKCKECLGDPTAVCIPEDGKWDYDWSTEELKN